MLESSGNSGPANNEEIAPEGAGQRPTTTAADASSFEYVNANHKDLMLKSQLVLRDTRKLCDVKLQGLDQTTENFACHRLVLSACSRVLLTMFTTDMLEAKKDVIILLNISGNTLKR